MTAVIVHQYDFRQQLSRRLVYDAADGRLNDGESFVQVDQHHADGRQLLWVLLLCTPVQEKNNAIWLKFASANVMQRHRRWQ